jgi:gliding motility-associated-like protein
MEKLIKSFVFIFLITTLSNISVYAKNGRGSYAIESLATAPPTVYSPVRYWKDCSKPLMAIPAGGGTLNWYLTNLPTEIPTAIAPTPITTTVGSTTTYYVSQSIAGIESIRVPIVVMVEADSGATILNLRCDRSQIPTYSLDYSPPATVNNAVLFDWSNNNAFLSHAYFCTYSIQGGTAITEFNPKMDESHFIVANLLPGQSVELTLTSASHPCVPSQKMTCSVPCVSTITPDFLAIPTTYCINEVVTDLPRTSANAITGSWDSLAVNTTTAGTANYTFTPDPVLFPCATSETLSVTVGPVEPDFGDFSICSGETAPALSNSSPNGITGTWNPLTIDNMNSATYTFTPDPGQPCSPTDKTIAITVNPSNTIVNLSWTVTEAFAKNQTVTVTDPVGANYVYRLDDGSFQVSTVFENVSLGTHSITVQDVNGCSEFRNDNVLVINYPKFFTPNDDNYNDTWNIFSLADQSNSKILIFDRYGKLLKEIRPSGPGWDGTYIGQPMPANDYWFTVEYTEQDILKKFKSHFSLKR